MEASKYAKFERGLAPHPYEDAENSYDEFLLRISLGDSSLDDSFTLVIPFSESQKKIGDVLNEVFPEDETRQFEVIERLDTALNPDLPEMYEELLDMVSQWRAGDNELSFYLNHGREAQPYELVNHHLLSFASGRGEIVGVPVLDIVIERYFEVLRKYEGWGGDRHNLLEWMRTNVALYFMDKHAYEPPVEDSNNGAQLSMVIEDLRNRKYIAAGTGTQVYEITEIGRDYLGHLIRETESYIQHYDIYKDVLIDTSEDAVDFETGEGLDLRVQVYDHEGMDLVRVVFLIRMYDGTFDALKESWQDDIVDEAFFNDILLPVLDHDIVDNETIEWVIESGRAHIEERAESEKERDLRRDATRRLE